MCVLPMCVQMLMEGGFTHTRKHACGDQKMTSGVAPLVPVYLFLRQALNLPSKPGWVASEPQRCPDLHFLGAKIRSTYHHPWLFLLGFLGSTQDLILQSKHFTEMKLPSPDANL